MSTLVDQVRSIADPTERAKAANKVAIEQGDLADDFGNQRDALIYRAVDTFGERYGWNLLAIERSGVSNGLWYRTLKRRKDTNYAPGGNPNPKYVLPELPEVALPDDGRNLDGEGQTFAQIKDLHKQAVAALKSQQDAIAIRYAAMCELFPKEPSNIKLAGQLGMDKQMVGKARRQWRESRPQALSA